ncbi:hypothetical protein Pelo_4959 [Pelomyxa schiedti]|nr:hypothetical protein Pelo_4959 [Pelomyxa schiedti]
MQATPTVLQGASTSPCAAPPSSTTTTPVGSPGSPGDNELGDQGSGSTRPNHLLSQPESIRRIHLKKLPEDTPNCVRNTSYDYRHAEKHRKGKGKEKLRTPLPWASVPLPFRLPQFWGAPTSSPDQSQATVRPTSDIEELLAAQFEIGRVASIGVETGGAVALAESLLKVHSYVWWVFRAPKDGILPPFKIDIVLAPGSSGGDLTPCTITAVVDSSHWYHTSRNIHKLDLARRLIKDQEETWRRVCDEEAQHSGTLSRYGKITKERRCENFVNCTDDTCQQGHLHFYCKHVSTELVAQNISCTTHASSGDFLFAVGDLADRALGGCWVYVRDDGDLQPTRELMVYPGAHRNNSDLLLYPDFWDHVSVILCKLEQDCSQPTTHWLEHMSLNFGKWDSEARGCAIDRHGCLHLILSVQGLCDLIDGGKYNQLEGHIFRPDSYDSADARELQTDILFPIIEKTLTEMHTQHTQFTTHSEVHTEPHPGIAPLHSELHTEFTALTVMNAKLDAMNTKLDSMNTKLDSMNTKLDSMNTNLEALLGSLEGLQAQANSPGSRTLQPRSPTKKGGITSNHCGVSVITQPTSSPGGHTAPIRKKKKSRKPRRPTQKGTLQKH